ncbi:MAG: hypothetical protein V1679_02420 [Candidatus Peregrinibacteria bacterium]
MPDDSKLALIKELIESAEGSIRSAKKMMQELTGEFPKKAKSAKKQDYSNMTGALKDQSEDEEGNKIVEGVFNGQIMIDKNDQEYPVPANYASKSKLIPGDILKLTIKDDGSFLYKQIGPIDRKRIIGTLTYEDGQYKVIAEGKAYNVLLASVTYFKAEIGDKITLVVPTHEESQWGAIENVLPREEEEMSEAI